VSETVDTYTSSENTTRTHTVDPESGFTLTSDSYNISLTTGGTTAITRVENATADDTIITSNLLNPDGSTVNEVLNTTADQQSNVTTVTYTDS